MADPVENTYTPEDGVAFDVRELVFTLKEALEDCQSGSERFPFLFTADGKQVTKVTVERVSHSDQSSNLEIRLHTA